MTSVSIMIHGYDFIAAGNTKRLLAARKALDNYLLKVTVLGKREIASRK